MFCPNCGTSMFIDFRESDREDERDEIGFNVCLERTAGAFKLTMV
jgi:hypothetical protein